MNLGMDIYLAMPEMVDPDKYIVATYYVESSLSLVEAGARIAAEESIGTWTDIKTVTDWAKENLAAKVFYYAGEDEGKILIAFPLQLFDLDTGGIPNILSIVAGNLFSLGSLKNVRLLDLEFPKEVVSSFPGPKFGIDGIRTLTGTLKDRRPHIGTIIKPKVGLNPKETAQVAYEAAIGGVDFIKDDETLTNQKFCPIEERVSAVMNALDRANSETGRKILYAVNITSKFDKILELADLAMTHGSNMLMIDAFTSGLSTIQRLAQDPSIKVPLHIHRTMHGAFTRNPRHGIRMLPLAKIIRLAGGDQLHTGTVAGKMEHTTSELFEINDFLRKEWFGVKPVFPVASGGVYPGILGENIEKLGVDVVINAGGGIHGNPMGSRAGAAAMRQALDAYLKGIPVLEYAETHAELKAALDKWGTGKEEGQD
jgi:ribulose-bisphosphate carboxylase large chain